MQNKENYKGCVYFFRHIGLTPIKIGYSTNESPLDRFNQFKTYAPYGSEILGFIITNDPKGLETRLHLKYLSKRLAGEWFELTQDEVIKEIDFYSKFEDIKDRNEFQIAWAKELNERKKNIAVKIEENDNRTKKDKFLDMYKNNQNLNKTIAAKKLGVTRKCLYDWIKVNTTE
jgi:hypothetical protein